MSPEQAASRPVAHHSDQFSFGIILYELLCGERPFKGDSVATVLSAILRDPPVPPSKLRSDIPADLEKVVRRCLEKDPEKRYESAQELQNVLVLCKERLTEEGKARGLTLKWRSIAAAAVLILALIATGVWIWLRGSGERWARDEALDEITNLTEVGDIYGAFRLSRAALSYLPGNQELQKTLNRITIPISVVTEPAGADVYIKGYSTPDAEWEVLGQTPLEEVRVPYALMRWKISLEGFETFEGAPFGVRSIMALATGIALDPVGTRPDGMVRIPEGLLARPDLPPAQVGNYWLDRYEVTNQQFKEFVDGGGYEQADLWNDLFSEAGREVAWQEVVESFRDATGRPGPATWELGTYPEGQGEFPVGGVSWYEAAAYCKSIDKSLPTIYHWFAATAQDQLSDILEFSNFGTNGPAAAGTYQGQSDFGTYDMPGNVKEWCWNATEDKRYIVGGAWEEPTYMYKHPDAAQPLERLPTHGFRCARYIDAPKEALLDAVNLLYDYGKTEPVGDEVFEAYRRMYAYDPTDLRATVDAVDESSPHWRKEAVSFDAAYGGERVTALLFLPRDSEPPYQAVIWYPGDDAFFVRSSDNLASAYLFDFIPRSGRALVYPIYKGMYERFIPFSWAPNEWRDMVISWSKDIGRTIDYLESREDIVPEKLAYYGFSGGAVYGPIFDAVDGRFKASILLAGGLAEKVPPEMEVVNFAPRSRVPTLMVNGRDDFIMPVEQSQRPLFDLLGAPEESKRHALLDGGHIPSDRLAIIKEVLDWLDRCLGPVKTSTIR
jgi:pimeloyl-ACP methyl ester carboxylesterase